MESHQGGPKGEEGGGRAIQLWKGRHQDGEEVGKAYRNLPAVLGEIRLNIFQCHHSTLSAVRAEEISRGVQETELRHSQSPEQLGCYRSHVPSCLVFSLVKNFP